MRSFGTLFGLFWDSLEPNQVGMKVSNLICRVVKAHEVLTASKDATSIFGGRENAKKKMIL